MRVDAKPNIGRHKSFWASCSELWHAALDSKPSNAADERIEIQASKLGVRQDVPHQMQAMAKLFGISPHLLQKPEGRALRLMRKCNGCEMSSECFVNDHGKPDQQAHVSPRSCPNFSEYQNMAREIGSRTAIKNKLV